MEIEFAPGASTNRLTPGALEMWNSVIAAAERVGIAKLRFNAGHATTGHVSHGHGTEIDILGYNADGTTWNARQRLAMAEAAAQAGGNRFGFYTRPDRPVSVLHMGVGYPGAVTNAAWGPNGLTSGVDVNSFLPEERAFVMALRNGTMGNYTPTYRADRDTDLMAYASGETPPTEAFQLLESSTPNLNALIQRGGFLTPGDNGDAVRELQRFLNLNGFKDASGQSLAEDGDFGPRTRQALMSFQRGNEITADGVVGPETFSHVFETITGSTAPPVIAPTPPPQLTATASAIRDGQVIRPGDTGDAVRELQEFLNFMGATDAAGRPLTADGEFGPRTREALRTYQRVNGLNPDAVVGPQTLEMIRYDQLRQTPVTNDGLVYEEADDRMFARSIARTIDTQGIVAGMPQVAIDAPRWGPPAVPPGWRPITEADARPVPTTQEWTTRRPPVTGIPDGPNAETPYDEPVNGGPSPQPPAQRPNVQPGIREPNFATMSLQALADYRVQLLSRGITEMPEGYEVAYRFRRDEAQLLADAAAREAAIYEAGVARENQLHDQRFYRAQNGTSPRIAPPAPFPRPGVTIGEGEYLPHEFVLLRQLSNNMNMAPKPVTGPHTPLVGAMRYTPTSYNPPPVPVTSISAKPVMFPTGRGPQP